MSPAGRRIASNAGWLMGERVLRGVIAVTVSVAIARYLGPSDFGVLSFAVSFVLLFSTLQTLGLSGIVVQDLVQHPDRHSQIMGSVFTLRLLGGVVSTGVILVSSSLLGFDDPLTRAALLILSIAMLFRAFDGVELWLEAEVRSRYAVTARSGAFIVSAALSLALIVVGAPLMAFVVAAGLEFVFIGLALIGVYVLLGHSPRSWLPSFASARSLLGRSWPLIVSGGFAAVNLRVDQVMLSLILGPESVGTYAAAARLSEVWYFLPAAFVASVFPSLIRSRQQSTDDYRTRLQNAYDLMAWIALPVAVAVSLASDQIIQLLYGSQYSEAAPILSVHIWGGPFMFMGVILSKWLIAEDLLKFSMLRHGTGALVNVVLNLMLIPTLGGLGAALATLVSYAIASYGACWMYAPARPAAIQMTRALVAPARLASRLLR